MHENIVLQKGNSKIVVYLTWHKSPKTLSVPPTCTLTLKVACTTWCTAQESLHKKQLGDLLEERTAFPMYTFKVLTEEEY